MKRQHDIEARRFVRAHLLKHRATLSTAVFGGRQHLTAWFPNGTSDEVVARAQADGWVVVLGKPFGWTEPHLGGRRAWFRCCSCGRRCTVVYGRQRQWGCRCCWRANYPSQKEAPFDRLIRRAGRLRRRLGDTVCKVPIDYVDFAGSPPDKPRRMHWRTYHRLAGSSRRSSARRHGSSTCSRPGCWAASPNLEHRSRDERCRGFATHQNMIQQGDIS